MGRNGFWDEVSFGLKKTLWNEEWGQLLMYLMLINFCVKVVKRVTFGSVYFTTIKKKKRKKKLVNTTLLKTKTNFKKQQFSRLL